MVLSLLPNKCLPKAPRGTRSASTAANVIVHWTQSLPVTDQIVKFTAKVRQQLFTVLDHFSWFLMVFERFCRFLNYFNQIFEHFFNFLIFFCSLLCQTFRTKGLRLRPHPSFINKRRIYNQLVSLSVAIYFNLNFTPLISSAGKIGGARPTDGSGCPRCGFVVYEAEKMISKNKSWHKRCFNCSDCRKSLDSTNLCDGPNGEIYCRGKQVELVWSSRVFRGRFKDFSWSFR